MISVIIPTCGRTASLKRTLASLKNQVLKAAEIIVIDASDDPLSDAEKELLFEKLPVSYIHHQPRSLCVQRNLGIQMVKFPFILFCDDDIELPSQYIQELTDYLCAHKEVNIASGLVMERPNGEWVYEFQMSNPALVFHYMFGLSIWFTVKINESDGWLVRQIKHDLISKRNTLSKAGWPQNIDLNQEFNCVVIYGLGAALFRSSWLKYHSYDEKLFPDGIGDHYGVCLANDKGITVLANIRCKHYKELSGRSSVSSVHRLRCFAVAHFQSEQKQQLWRVHFCWSMVGLVLLHASRRDWRLCISDIFVLTGVFFGFEPYSKRRSSSRTFSK